VEDELYVQRSVLEKFDVKADDLKIEYQDKTCTEQSFIDFG